MHMDVLDLFTGIPSEETSLQYSLGNEYLAWQICCCSVHSLISSENGG